MWPADRHPACHGRRASSLSIQWRLGTLRCVRHALTSQFLAATRHLASVVASTGVPPNTGSFANSATEMKKEAGRMQFG